MGPGEGPELRGSCLRLGTSRTQRYLFLSVCLESHSSFIISKTAAKLSGIAPRFHFSSFNCAPSHSTDQQANNNTQKRNEEILVSRPGWGDLLLKSWEQSQIHPMVGLAMGGGAVLGFCNLLWEMRPEDWNLKERIFQFHIAGHKSPYGEIDSTLSLHHTPLHLPSWPPQLEIYKSRARPGFIFFHPGKGILWNGFSDMSFLILTHSHPSSLPPPLLPPPKWDCFNEQLAHFSVIFVFPKVVEFLFFSLPFTSALFSSDDTEPVFLTVDVCSAIFLQGTDCSHITEMLGRKHCALWLNSHGGQVSRKERERCLLVTDVSKSTSTPAAKPCDNRHNPALSAGRCQRQGPGVNCAHFIYNREWRQAEASPIQHPEINRH